MLNADLIHRTRDTATLLKSGLNLIQQALSIYSSDLRLIFANRQFGQMFDLPETLTTPGAAFDETVAYLAARGEYGDVGDVDEFVHTRVTQALAFEQHYVERKRANGRWVSIEGGPLRQGGWVTVYTDITEMRQQEEILRSRSDDLSGKLLDRSAELARTNRALEATINRLHETQQHLEAAEARIRLAAETTPAHIARINRAERYTYTNQKLPITAANGADNIVGHTARDVLGEQVYTLIQPALQSALAGDPKVVEFTDPDTHRQIRVAFTPDTSDRDDVSGAYVLSMDVTAASSGTGLQRRAKFGRWTVNFDRLELSADNGQTVKPLSVSEAALLRSFLQAANRVVTRLDLMDADAVASSAPRALDVRIARLRQKLEDSAKAPKLIRTVYGAGYLLTADVKWMA